MASLATAAAVATLASAGASAAGTLASGQASGAAAGLEATAYGQRADAAEETGKAALESAKFDAAQLREKSLEEIAQGQQDAVQIARTKKLALSTLQARGAASGFTATDATSLDLAKDIEEYGSLQERLALYGAKARASGLRNQAAARTYEGKSARRAGQMEADSLRTGAAATRAAGKGAKTGSYLSAAGTVLGGVSTMASRYAKK